jgi:uncharacterized membrane protein
MQVNIRHDRKEQIMKAIVAAMLTLSLACAGCAGMSDTQQRTLSGAAIGTAAGGIVGAMAGNTGMGLAIGAAAGAGGGYLYDKHKQTEQEAYEKGVQDGKKAQ